MAKPDYFLIIDTETTQPRRANHARGIEGIPSLVADFGAVVVNRKGKIMSQCGILVLNVYNNMEKHPLFHTGINSPTNIWGEMNLERRYKAYNQMLVNGQRQLASVSAINAWLEKVERAYNPYMTAYNIAFDKKQCDNTGIHLARFRKKEFCLWFACVEKWAFTKKYRDFILKNNFFKNATAPTDRYPRGNLSYPTNAEVMTRFNRNDALYADEPHTALEDVIDYELPLLLDLVNSTPKKKWKNPPSFNWQQVQVKDWYIPK